ncbi:NAD(P)-binding protein [Cystobasidium minutum MCA 4210]|uniref:NAD(P)-binding protein n=1 Tax=Cystobasidium minutum MCA 4210 TaxID=1397322 RepID=UPI0034CE3582|eukprot:jgi/Rhomi1/196186/gm1.4400_g
MSSILEKGSLVLVTGANGFLGSHVVDQFLAEGYKVRGTVRKLDGNDWLQEYFDKKYAPGLLELVQVEDLTKDHSLDEAVKGAKAFVHVASDVSFRPDPNLVVPVAVKSTQSALASAATEPGLKAFVLTSSSAAASSVHNNTHYHISKESWNDEAVKAAWAPAPYEPERGPVVYAASKTEGEKAAWEWVKEHNPHFNFNAVLPNLIIGNILIPESQHGSTSGWIRGLNGPAWAMAQQIPNQYFVHPVDTARLHVAAATDPSIKDERLFAFSEPYTWNKILEIARRVKPDVQWPADLENDDKDLSTVANEPSVKISKERFGQDGFLSLERGVTDALLS